MVKVTFTLDDDTVRLLRLMAERQHKSKSALLREALREYHVRGDRVSEAERERRVAALKDFIAENPPRDPAEVRRELEEIRAVRRGGGRLHPVE